MELLLTLSNIKFLNKLTKSEIDGIIYGGPFSMKFNYSKDEISKINSICLEKNIKSYISIDAFILEDDLNELYDYLEYISKLNIDGIYFNDLAILANASKYNLQDKLIYDSNTLSTNINDIGFYLNKKIDVCLARELTLNEIMEIIKEYPYQLDMQIFGHLRMSYSKRKFLSNYFKEIKKDIDIVDAENIRLLEETRSYKLPIKETKYGTSIFTDYVFLMYEEYPYLKKLLKRGIIDTEFIDNETIYDLLRDARRITVDNADFLRTTFVSKHNNYHYDLGYLYQKTVDKKEENE